MKVAISGIESSGKSLYMIKILGKIVYRNAAWEKKTGVKRPILVNFPLAEHFVEWITVEMGCDLIQWENIDDLIQYENCDIFIDELGNYFDARNWENLSLNARKWLTQGAKRGIEIYGACQDFAQVDKAFRRLVNHLIHIKKLCGSRRPSATTPPVKWIWGVCLMLELDPAVYKEDKDKFAMKSALSLRFFPIEKKYCNAYDTTAKIKISKPPKMKHLARECEDLKCGFHRVQHV